MPWPAQIMGRSARSSRSAASSTAPGSAATRMRGMGVYSRSPLNSALQASSSTSSITGPGRPERRAVKACRNRLGASSGEITLLAILVVAR